MTNGPLKNEKVAILGAGPGGLTAARLLQMAGANVTVYERDAGRHVRVQGATLNLNAESGLRAIRAAGLAEAFSRAYRPGAEKLAFLDLEGRPVIAMGGRDVEADRPEIDRGPLRDVLLDSLLPGTVIWDAHVRSLARTEAGVTVAFDDGTTAHADLVVAADGAGSNARPFVTSTKPAYSGITIVEGTLYEASQKIPKIHAALDGGKIVVLGNRRSLFLVMKGDDSVAFYSGHRAAEGWAKTSGIDFADRDAVLAWFRTELAGFEAWEELFVHASSFVPRPQYCAPPDQTWEALPNLTLLGDAAHVMPPFAGEGVNMAMLDALELAEHLVGGAHADVKSAIAAYERGMRTRCGEAARQTMLFTEAFHSDQAIPFFQRFFEEVAAPDASRPR